MIDSDLLEILVREIKTMGSIVSTGERGEEIKTLHHLNNGH